MWAATVRPRPATIAPVKALRTAEAESAAPSKATEATETLSEGPPAPSKATEEAPIDDPIGRAIAVIKAWTATLWLDQ